jgi:YHS domain-containing protein
MVNDQVFPRDQIPVLVAGRTYYGCCSMCKERLLKDVETRSAVDPVTGKKIDKATAVIAAREDGTVIYFATEANFTKYLTEIKKHL